MYIIQMADLHIGSEKNEGSEKKILDKSIDEIKSIIPQGAEVLLCLCGDIIDSEKIPDEKAVCDRYEKAGDLIKNFVTNLEDDYRIWSRCCPGNHDITHEKEFGEFVNKLSEDKISNKQLKSCYSFAVSSEKITFIFVNSCLNNSYKAGGIEYDQLETMLKNTEGKKILVIHHTLMSMFPNDTSSIRDAAGLVLLAEKYEVSAILHGHIHGKDIITMGKNMCPVIGTGALFSRNNQDVNSQFNIIKWNGNLIEKVYNCRYCADNKADPWESPVMYDNTLQKECIFKGKSFEEVYEKVSDSIDKNKVLNQLRIEIDSEFSTFQSELKTYLEGDKLEIGKHQYSYFDLAKMWEQDTVPDKLYFNHGSYFSVDDQSGIDFVYEQLREKPTSNRIVLSTYNMKKIQESLGDKTYLPSLESIQFGKNGNTLMVHMHLRALEVCHFLKINICEIEYLLSQLKSKGIEFETVNIVISSFRAQKKQKFNCFLKAEIDTLDPFEICGMVMAGEVGKICELLKEKQDGSETITRSEGIQNLYNAIIKSSSKSKLKKYPDDVLDTLKEVLNIYDSLNNFHKKESVPDLQEKQCEEQVQVLLGNVINELEKGEKDNS